MGSLKYHQTVIIIVNLYECMWLKCKIYEHMTRRGVGVVYGVICTLHHVSLSHTIF